MYSIISQIYKVLNLKYRDYLPDKWHTPMQYFRFTEGLACKFKIALTRSFYLSTSLGQFVRIGTLQMKLGYMYLLVYVTSTLVSYDG